MIIKAVEAGPIQANCYILMDEETKEIVIMDPGGEAEMLSEEIDNFKGNVKFIIFFYMIKINQALTINPWKDIEEP